MGEPTGGPMRSFSTVTLAPGMRATVARMVSMVTVDGSTRTFCPSVALAEAGRKSTVMRAWLAAPWAPDMGSPVPETPVSAT